MVYSLMVTALLMGLSGIPHCTAMCGAACAAVLRKPVPLSALLGRWIGYASLGAVAAASGSLAAQWSRQSAVLQPLWVLAQVAALVLGLYLAGRGRMPVALDQWGQGLYRRIQLRTASSSWVKKVPGTAMLAPLVAGVAWAALPCGLLYGAVMVAALANGPLEGALVMTAFALPSAFGLWAAPWLLRRMTSTESDAATFTAVPVPMIWLKRSSSQAGAETNGQVMSPVPGRPRWSPRWNDSQWAIRLAGLMLACMSAWAIYHRLLDQWRAWCA
ncbi:MAG: sulfite exporter TauE/SafE family protein [Burkholderiales bacterium]|nr:sulfite exporter TauE/SafE family protein [Burkholderiales bacterium]